MKLRDVEGSEFCSDRHMSSYELKTQICDAFAGTLELEPKAKLRFDEQSSHSDTMIDFLRPYGSRFYRSYVVDIGLKSVISNLKDGYVRDVDSVQALKAVFHEEGHVFLSTKKYGFISESDVLLNMAKVSVASRYFPEYYSMGYYHNPEELYCELYAFKKLESFFAVNNFNMDWKAILVKQANENYNFIDFADSYESLKHQYRHNVESAYYDFRFNAERLIVDHINKNHVSRELDELIANDLIYDVLNAGNGAEEVDILNKYIAEHHPSYFRAYQCLHDEYHVRNMKNVAENVARQVLNIHPRDGVVKDDDFLF